MYKLSEERTDYTDYIEKNQLEYPILNMLLFNDMGFSENCIKSTANHDSDIEPQVIEL